MFEKMNQIKLSGDSFPLKCDLLVLEKIQDEYTDLGDFENRLTGFQPSKDALMTKHFFDWLQCHQENSGRFSRRNLPDALKEKTTRPRRGLSCRGKYRAYKLCVDRLYRNANRIHRKRNSSYVSGQVVGFV